MKKIVGFVFAILMFACTTSKVSQDVTLHQRPVAKKVQRLNRPQSTPVEVPIKKEQLEEQKENIQEEIRNEMPEEPVVEATETPAMKTVEKTISAEMPMVNADGELATASNIEKSMTYLTSDALQGRDSGSKGIELAAQYIESVFKANAVDPYYDTYRDVLSNYNDSFNVVGVLKGNDVNLRHEYIVIGAHYDHIGLIEAVNGDEIANGANDNASGTTTVLELARYFGNNKTNKRSIIFALFSAEEKGLLGSKHLAQNLKAANLNLYLMLNYEMVGVPLVGKDYLMYVTGFEESNLAGVCNMSVGRNLIGYLPKAKEFNLFQRSDNFPFYNQFNVPSQTFSTFDFTNFDHYHKVGDEASLMNFDHMATIVNRSIPMIESLANSPVQTVKLN